MSYSRDYSRAYVSDDPPLSAREGRTLKEHVELLHMVLLKHADTVDDLKKKVKELEENIENIENAENETDSESESKEENKDIKDIKDIKENKTKKYRIWSSFVLGAGAVFAYFSSSGKKY
jgi:predicted nuclease with TOPRIM domain